MVANSEGSIPLSRATRRLTGIQFRERGLKMYDLLVSNPLFRSLTDGELVILAYVGMAAALYILVSIPYRLGKRNRNGNDPTDKIISDTAKSLDPFGDPYGIMARYGSPNLPGGK